VISLLAATGFISLASLNLSAQGLYYDELHQVPAAFAYQGINPQFFSRAFISGKPLMTMSYSGAIKSGVYGLFLRFTGASFGAESWRWLGILIVAASFPCFALLARPRLSAVALVLFFLLLGTDTSVILATRHDWGPVALALTLRLLFLGTWLHGQAKVSVPARNSFALGCIVGFSIYEKLSNIVLLPVLLIVMQSPERRTLKHWRGCLAGGLLGGLPLVVANGISYVERGRWLSTSQVAAPGAKSLAGFFSFLKGYLELGDGADVSGFIVGGNHGFATVEAMLLSVCLIAAIGICSSSKRHRIVATLVACYLAVATGLYLLPNATGAHHWVIGTPFQYLALAMALERPDSPRPRRPVQARIARAVLIAAIALLLIVRAHGALDLGRALAQGQTSSAWDSSLTRLGEFAASRAGRDLFIAGNWGVATQIYCQANGYPYVVREILEWPPNPPLEESIDLNRFRSVYLVLKVPQSFPSPAVTRQLINKLEHYPELREVTPEPEATQLAGVTVRKFVRSNTVVRH
jgi:hypothetical protein